MFLSTGNVPVDDQIGWTQTIAKLNPLTPMLELARQGFLGDVAWDTTWPGLVAIALSSLAPLDLRRHRPQAPHPLTPRRLCRTFRRIATFSPHRRRALRRARRRRQ